MHSAWSDKMNLLRSSCSDLPNSTVFHDWKLEFGWSTQAVLVSFVFQNKKTCLMMTHTTRKKYDDASICNSYCDNSACSVPELERIIA